MSEIDNRDASDVLESAVNALGSIRGAKLTLAVWDAFDRAVQAMRAAVENEDLQAIERERRIIDSLDDRQSAVARLDDPELVAQPQRMRAASDNLTHRLNTVLARRAGSDGGGGRR